MDHDAGRQPRCRRSLKPEWPEGRRLTAAERYEFLADASRELAGSLDYEETLAGVAGRPLPFLGAWCIVDLLAGEDELRRAAIVHPDPEKQQLVDELRAGWPPSRDDPFGIPTVMRSGEPEWVPELTGEMLREVARDDENLRILRELRMGSLITVPMLARDTVLGAITYVAPEAGRTFNEEDVALATDLAVLSALAVENARLHAATHEIAEEARARRSEAERLTKLVGDVNERLLVSALREESAAERAQAMEKARSELMAALSHELRTPLSAILGHLSLLEMEQPGPLTDAQTTSLDRVRVAAEQLLRMVDQVLTFARVQAEREPVRVERVDVSEVAREALSLLGPLATQKDIELTGDLPSDPLTLETDADKVRQILLNLLSNAIKFTEEGEVCLELRRRTTSVRLRVIDTGEGISREDQERIFEWFRQADNPLHAPRGGTGLGLAITHALVELLGGEIALESELGVGTTFTVTLPSREEGGGKSGPRSSS